MPKKVDANGFEIFEGGSGRKEGQKLKPYSYNWRRPGRRPGLRVGYRGFRLPSWLQPEHFRPQRGVAEDSQVPAHVRLAALI